VASYVIFGTTQSTIDAVLLLLRLKQKVSCVVTLKKELLPDNSRDMMRFSRGVGIDCIEVEDINSKYIIEKLAGYECDYIYSNWPRMISEKVLKIPRRFAIGTHPTALPLNKGRHPLHWLIVLGIPYSMVSFFVLNELVDGGEILLQIPFSVGSRPIELVENDMNEAFSFGLERLTQILNMNKSYAGYAQDHVHGNFWRARDRHDVTIDPRMSGSMVLRTVNSFSQPYAGARLYYAKNAFLTIIGARIVDSYELHDTWRLREHGEVLKLMSKSIWLKVDFAVVELDFIENIPSDLKFRIRPPAYYLGTLNQ